MHRLPIVTLPLLAVLLAATALAPRPASAAECKYTAPRNMQLDLAGVQSVRVEVHSHDLHLRGGAGTGLTVAGRACASDQAALADLTVTQRREGNQLLLDLGNNRSGSVFNLFGSSYAYLDVTVQLPANLPVTLSVGSGDADVTGVRQLQAQVGSGDLHVRNIAERFTVSVGSGDINANDVGTLEVGAVGSGDFNATGVRGDVRVGSVGSGDVRLRQVGGNVHAETIGSGDLAVDGVAGDFSLGAKGSGDVTHTGVKGKVSVPHDDD
ncbi:MAG TPA: DUF4097 family beta strand repeat-containing protein [Rhodanobacter sp.]|nr:DUF4097 family beta strand repeat-containing protein [Rhodanobacter sp.]